MRGRDRLQRVFDRRPDPESVRLLDVVRALLSEDEQDAERVAAVLARDRERKARERAEQHERDMVRRRMDVVAGWIRHECETKGFWFPSDWH